MKLVARIKKIQEDVSSLQDQCRELLAAKQVLLVWLRLVSIDFLGLIYASYVCIFQFEHID